jgi:hypothetical protein
MEEKEKQDYQDQEELLTREEALKRMGKYAAYSAAVVTILLASPSKAKAGS